MRTSLGQWKLQAKSAMFWEKIFLGIFVVSIFVNVPLYVSDSFAYLLGEKKDFLILFLWASDVALAVLLAVYLWTHRSKVKQFPHLNKPQAWSIILVVALPALATFSNWKNILLPTISIYYLLLLYKGFVLHGTHILEKQPLRQLFEWTFISAATGEALLALYQFSQQHSAGLKYLGETILSPSMVGVAKIEAESVLFMRAYGTFAHPNVLGAMLAIALLLLINHLVAHGTKPFTFKRLFLVLQAGLILIALILTFSRAAWFSLTLAALCYAYTQVRNKVDFKTNILPVFAYLSVLGIVTLFLLLPLVQPRTNVIDKAYSERSSYNKAGVQYITDSPVRGIGAGQTLLHMEQSLGTSAKPWEVQPIHNYYLLYGSEYGVVAILALILYFYVLIKRKKLGQSSSDSAYFSLIVLVLILMLFDHYFYTIQSTILVFWLISSYFSFSDTTYDTPSPS